MNKKIYKDPFVLILASIIVIVALHFQITASQAPDGLTNYLRYISALSLTSLIIYIIAMPYLRKKHIKPVFGISVSLLIGFLLLAAMGVLAFSLAMSSG